VLLFGETIQHTSALGPLVTIVGPGDTEQRGYWVFVPPSYDPNKLYPVIYQGHGKGEADNYLAGGDGYLYQSVDQDQAILVGLDYDTNGLSVYDSTNSASNDFAFMPWLMSEIEGTLCVDVSREWMSGYADGAGLAQQLACAMPARLRGIVALGGGFPGSYSGDSVGLPQCHPAPIAAFLVHDVSESLLNLLPECSSLLQYNGCSSTICQPLDATLTTPYPVPAGVTLPTGAVCNQFKGCPADYPVVFCVTQNQSGSDGAIWGATALFWDFMNGLGGAMATCDGATSSTDVDNCGRCALTCSPDASCQNATCACPSTLTACGNACVNVNADPTNCGSCGAECPIGASCQGGTCACLSGEVTCAETCVDEETDFDNCGACGTVCSGGQACHGGVCACPCPTVLAVSNDPIAQIAIDSSSVYWTDEGSSSPATGAVMKVPLGGGKATVLASGQNQPVGIAVDGNNVYWTVNGATEPAGAVMKLSLAGGQPAIVASGQTNPVSVAVDASFVYWTNQGSNANAYQDGAVMKIPLSGGTPSVLATGQNAPQGLVVNAQGLYWISNAEVLLTLPLDSSGGGQPSQVAPTAPRDFNITGFATDATSVYWTEGTGGLPFDSRVMKVPLAGGTPTVLASGQDYPEGIAIDGSNVYWSTVGGAIMKTSLNGGPVVALTTGQPDAFSLFSDSTSIYFGLPSASIAKMTPK
jgi:sugar lactone lactonase YvrE